MVLPFVLIIDETSEPNKIVKAVKAVKHEKLPTLQRVFLVLPM